ncbi:MAG: hypothetical protein Q9N67_09865 [Ghiorsea sp.]|nr:hypothetical protein [Ghiorsea sp.]
MPFELVKRDKVTKSEPSITITNDKKVIYNKEFEKRASIDKNRYVKYFVDKEGWKLAFHVSSEKTADSYIIGENNGVYRSVLAKDISDYPWLRGTQIKAGYDELEKRWIVAFKPCFDRKYLRSQKQEIDPKHTGVYRYLHEEKVVYIGKGSIRDRLNEKGRDGWLFDYIEYFIDEDNNSALAWEAKYIQEHKDTYGQLPHYNKILGQTTREMYE